jgi:RsiW-degrading membrane proteinase PrsW (M82 family)
VIEVYRLAVSLAPVFLFLMALIFLDSFKLISWRCVLQAIGVGAAAAVISMLINDLLLNQFAIKAQIFRRYDAPLVEELVKALYLVFLFRRGRVGFLVDAAIYGFAIGAGFALVENAYYLNALQTPHFLVWLVRGFGTAVLHGTTMVIFAVITKVITDRGTLRGGFRYLPGFAAAVLVHSLFNHFILSPMLSTLLIMVTLPLLIVLVFSRSERATRNWLGEGWNADVELLESITTGEITETRVGAYLNTLRDRFAPQVVADMLCLLQLHLELAMSAKGILLAQEAGIKVPPDPDLKAKFAELAYLEKSIGKTGLLTLHPFLYSSSRDLWQRQLLNG